MRLKTFLIAVLVLSLGLLAYIFGADAMSTYQDKASGISFSYPKGWKVLEKPEKNVLVKIQGTTASGSEGEITLDVSNIDPGTTLEQFGQQVEEQIIKQRKDGKKLKEERIRFGRGSSIEGLSQLCTFNMFNNNFRQRYVHFLSPSIVYTFTFTALDEQYKDLAPVYDSVLASVVAQNAKVKKKESPPKKNSKRR